MICTSFQPEPKRQNSQLFHLSCIWGHYNWKCKHNWQNTFHSHKKKNPNPYIYMMKRGAPVISIITDCMLSLLPKSTPLHHRVFSAQTVRSPKTNTIRQCDHWLLLPIGEETIIISLVTPHTHNGMIVACVGCEKDDCRAWYQMLATCAVKAEVVSPVYMYVKLFHSVLRLVWGFLCFTVISFQYIYICNNLHFRWMDVLNIAFINWWLYN